MRNRNGLYVLILLIASALFNKTYASVSSDLEKVFQSLGQGVNVTEAQSYQGQRAGFYTGGSLFTRTPVREYSLAHVQLPSIKAGCGGIDLFTGGFSFINSDELVRAFKNIANQAVSYSFLLGLETVSPLIKNQMVELQNKADAINRLNINSCQTTSLLVGGLWPKTEEASRQICESIGTSQNLFADRVKARHKCADPSERQRVMNAGKKDDAWKELIIDDTNIAWATLQKNDFFSHDKQVAELLLSLSGSIIITSNKPEILPSLVNQPKFIQALLFGGSLSLYRCDNAQCLHPSKIDTTINESASIVSQVKNTVERLLGNIKTDTEPTRQDIVFLESMNLPIYKILAVDAAFYGDVTNLMDYADVIALDILFHYLNDNIHYLETSSLAMQYPMHLVMQYKEMLLSTKNDINKIRQNLLQKKTVNTQLIEKTRMLEQMLAGQLTSDLSIER